jgi:glycosyltransferase domain-containing protein
VESAEEEFFVITLLLAIHNRPNCLQRCLSYYKELNFPVIIIVLDSSSQQEQLLNQKCIKDLETDCFVPIYKSFSEDVSYIEKLYYGTRFISTTYACLASCDDFFSRQGLIESMKFLRNNSDYAFCAGYYYGFTFKESKIDWYYLGYIDNMRSIENGDPLERINAYMDKITTMFYSCFRSDSLISIVKDGYKQRLNEVFFESFLVIMGLLKGKGKYLAIPYFYKELSSKSKGVELQSKWLLGKNFLTNKELFTGAIELGLQGDLFCSLDSKKIAINISDRFFDNIAEKSFSYSSCKINIFYKSVAYFCSQYFCRIFWALSYRIHLFNKKYIYMQKRLETGIFFFQSGTPYYDEIILVKKKINISKVYVSHHKLDGLIPL